MKCIKCHKDIPLTKNSQKYCSNRCSKLYLKARYKKKYRDEINKYNREYKKGMRRGIPGGKNTRKFEREGKVIRIEDGKECYFCKRHDSLEWHHISYDPPIIVVRICRDCHRKLHKLLRKQ